MGGSDTELYTWAASHLKELSLTRTEWKVIGAIRHLQERTPGQGIASAKELAEAAEVSYAMTRRAMEALMVPRYNAARKLQRSAYLIRTTLPSGRYSYSFRPLWYECKRLMLQLPPAQLNQHTQEFYLTWASKLLATAASGASIQKSAQDWCATYERDKSQKKQQQRAAKEE